MRHPRLRSDYVFLRTAAAAGTQAVIAGETRSVLLDDEATADLLDLLDGTRTVAQLIAELTDRHPAGAVGAVLRRLAALDLLAEGPTRLTAARAATWDSREIDPDRAEDWLRTGRVTLVATGGQDGSPVAAGLTAAGLQVDLLSASELTGTVLATMEDTRQLVAVPSSYLDADLDRVNALCREAGRAWTLVRAHGSVLLLGPHLVAGETGCWHCLRQRWQDNEQLQNYLVTVQPDLPRLDTARASHHITGSVLAGLLAAELPVLALDGRSRRITGQIIAFDMRDLSVSEHVLIRQPQCACCGDPSLVTKAKPRIELGTTEDPADRLSLAQTWGRVQNQVSRYLGVVSRLTPIELPDAETTEFFGYSATHSFAPARNADMLRLNLRGQSGGKGRTDLQAKVGAVGEAIERYCGVWRPDLPGRRASHRALGPQEAVPLADLLHFSADQYARREELNPTLSHFHRIPRPADEDMEMDWSTAWSLTRGTTRAVPAAYCWYGHPELQTIGVAGADSNGCAAGNNLAEAVLHGFCELVERDSVALWWQHRSRLPGVDLDSFDDPWLSQLQRSYRQNHDRELWALDLTADLRLPAFAAISAHRSRPTEDILVGFGASPDPGVALRRAMSELTQFLPTVSRFESGRTRYGLSDAEAIRWFTTARLADQPWLLPDPDHAASTADHVRAVTHFDSSATAADLVSDCVRRAAEVGLEVIVLDQSRPDIDLTVARVIVPGLRHFWRRLGPGRLWDVPARLGRSPLAMDETQVNPMNIFF